MDSVPDAVTRSPTMSLWQWREVGRATVSSSGSGLLPGTVGNQHVHHRQHQRGTNSGSCKPVWNGRTTPREKGSPATSKKAGSVLEVTSK